MEVNMAVMKAREAIYDAAKKWAEECLVEDRSVFDEQSIYTKARLDELDTHYVKNLDESKRDFMTKLEDQLAPTSPEAKRLAAELLWAAHFFNSSLLPATKLVKIGRVRINI
jgi:5-methylcytosine-specific restriction protein B